MCCVGCAALQESPQCISSVDTGSRLTCSALVTPTSLLKELRHTEDHEQPLAGDTIILTLFSAHGYGYIGKRMRKRMTHLACRLNVYFSVCSTTIHYFDDLYHTCTFEWASVFRTHNSSLDGATELKFAPFCSS